ncbi:MAG: hypothetical protein HYW86_00330 [Candidatus Roizmanbacteria bacterium]|nr:MAG: hypothetical protein HYW86_00330 [Candidatus Roizmanbacteria bacterium]
MDKFDKSKFTTIPYQKKIDKPWGYEIIYTPENASATGKILHIDARKRISLQYHDEKSETLCLIKGQAVITLSNQNGETEEIPMEHFKGYFITPGQIHRITAIIDTDICESSIPEIGNTVRLQDDVGRPTETEEMRRLENRGWKKQ